MPQALVLILILFVRVAAVGQDSSNNFLRHINKVFISTSNLGYNTELALSKSISVSFVLALGRSYYPSEHDLGSRWQLFNPSAFTSINPRWYYNRADRMAKGKLFRLNSGNYVGLSISTISTPLRGGSSSAPTFLANAHWGLQRAVAGRWLAGASIGGGYGLNIDDNFGTIYPSLSANIAYVISARLRKKDKLALAKVAPSK